MADQYHGSYTIVREDEETIVYRKGVHGMFGNTARFVGNDLVTRDTSVR